MMVAVRARRLLAFSVRTPFFLRMCRKNVIKFTSFGDREYTTRLNILLLMAGRHTFSMFRIRTHSLIWYRGGVLALRYYTAYIRVQVIATGSAAVYDHEGTTFDENFKKSVFQGVVNAMKCGGKYPSDVGEMALEFIENPMFMIGLAMVSYATSDDAAQFIWKAQMQAMECMFDIEKAFPAPMDQTFAYAQTGGAAFIDRERVRRALEWFPRFQIRPKPFLASARWSRNSHMVCLTSYDNAARSVVKQLLGSDITDEAIGRLALVFQNPNAALISRKSGLTVASAWDENGVGGSCVHMVAGKNGVLGKPYVGERMTNYSKGLQTDLKCVRQLSIESCPMYAVLIERGGALNVCGWPFRVYICLVVFT